MSLEEAEKEFVQLTFIKNSRGYVGGNQVGFPLDQAIELVAEGAAVFTYHRDLERSRRAVRAATLVAVCK